MAEKDPTPKKAKAKRAKKPKEKNLPGKPLKFPDLDELNAKIEAYFAWCNPHIEYIKQPVVDAKGFFKRDTAGEYMFQEAPITTKQRPYTVSGLAYFLDTTRSTLLDYERLAEMDSEELPQKLRTKDPILLRQYSYTIKRAKSRCEGFVEEKLLGGGHPAGAIFNLKNNFRDWKDQTEVVNSKETENSEKIEELRKILVKRVASVKKKKP